MTRIRVYEHSHLGVPIRPAPDSEDGWHWEDWGQYWDGWADGSVATEYDVEEMWMAFGLAAGDGRLTDAQRAMAALAMTRCGEVMGEGDDIL